MKATATVVYTLVAMSAASAAVRTPPYTPVKLTPTVAPYTIKRDLGNISNLKQFGKFTAEQKGLLAKNGFFAAPSPDKQLYLAYEKNDYLVIPNFVSCDTVLQLYHIFFDYSLRQVEAERLIPLCEKLTRHMYEAALADWRAAQNAEVKKAALKNVAYFGVAMKCLELKPDIPREAEAMVSDELVLIAKHEGRESSAIFPYSMDFSQFVPRGHYTRNEALKRYFKGMMWYGLVPFPLFQGKVMYEQIRQSLLITRTLYETQLSGKPAIETWERIYEPTVFYVETADDLTPAEWREVALKVWGHLPGPPELADKANLDRFYQLASKLRAPRIATFRKDAPLVERIWYIPTGQQFRFMGQRQIPDSYMLQQLVWSNVGTREDQRRMPMGLDILAALGSARAYWILDKVYSETHYAHYDERLGKLKKEFAAKTGDDWRQNLYWGWLWTLKSLLDPPGKGYPSFMRNNAWLDKSLNTALASWAEMRHDTILYAKQSMTSECGDGQEKQPPVPRGYVEPAVETYHRMLWLNKTTREGLRARNLLTRDLDESFGQMDDLLAFLERISIKELTGKKITAGEYDQIRLVGAHLETTTNTITKSMEEQGLVTETDEDMAVVADVHTDALMGACLEEGVGHANHIYVVAPIEGKLVLTRGAIFSYSEFTWPMSDRLTDEKWQAMLGKPKAPKPPQWTQTFLTGPKAKIPTPKMPRTAGHGC